MSPGDAEEQGLARVQGIQPLGPLQVSPESNFFGKNFARRIRWRLPGNGIGDAWRHTAPFFPRQPNYSEMSGWLASCFWACCRNCIASIGVIEFSSSS